MGSQRVWQHWAAEQKREKYSHFSGLYCCLWPSCFCCLYYTLIHSYIMNQLSSGTWPFHWPNNLDSDFFFLIAFSGVFCPNFLFNLQKLHNDLCRYHTSIVVVVIVVVFHLIWSYLFLSSYKEWRRGFICTVVVFVCFFQKDLITLSDIRNYPLTSLDHISPWSFSLDHKSEISSI